MQTKRRCAMAVCSGVLALACASCGGSSGYRITGTIAATGSEGSSGTETADVAVTLAGTVTTFTRTDSSGRYSFTGLPNGTYTVTPSSTYFTYAPPSSSVTLANSDAIGQDFSATSIVKIDSVSFVSTSVAIGACLSFTAVLDSHSQGLLDNIVIQSWVQQGSANRAASGHTVGVFIPGTRSETGSVCPSNSFAGQGVLVPGPATGVVQVLALRPLQADQVLDTKTTQITLTN